MCSDFSQGLKYVCRKRLKQTEPPEKKEAPLPWFAEIMKQRRKAIEGAEKEEAETTVFEEAG